MNSYQDITQALEKAGPEVWKRLVTEWLPRVWPKIYEDQQAMETLRRLVDDATIKEYKNQHMDHI